MSECKTSSTDKNFSLKSFLQACKITTPQCEECKKDARFLLAITREINHGLSDIEFHRVCFEHLTPELGFNEESEAWYSYEFIDLKSELTLAPFTQRKIEEETRPYYINDLAFRELKTFAETTVKEDAKLVNTEVRAKMIAECEVEFGADWNEYLDAFKKLFCCCRNNEDYKSFIETRSTDVEIFSSSSCDLYQDFFTEMLWKHEIFTIDDISKKLGEFAPCVKNVGIIFSEDWFTNYITEIVKES